MLSRDGAPDTSVHDALQFELDSWIESARRGDRAALAKALMSFRDYLLLVANENLEPTLRGKEGASDLVQETFLRAQRGLSSFRGSSADEWRNWLRGILIRHIANERRRFAATAKRSVGREVPIQDWAGIDPPQREATPSRELRQRERETALLDALGRLPEHYRDVVIMHHRDQQTFLEIGRRRGISEEAARKLWTRALGRLRKELGSAHELR
jgi:RNA polymerase sigma-70 factor, ECF subfamily